MGPIWPRDHRYSAGKSRPIRNSDALEPTRQHQVTLFRGSLDPLKAGLVTNLSRPGGNLTGITLDAGIEIWGKRLELLKEAVPSAANVAFLSMRGGWEGSSERVLRDA